MEVIKTFESRAIFFVMHRNIIGSKNQLQYYFYSKHACLLKPCLKSPPPGMKTPHGTLEQSCLTSSPITRAINSKPPKQIPMPRVQRAASPLVVLLGKVGLGGGKTVLSKKNGFSFPKKRGDSKGDTSPLIRL